MRRSARVFSLAALLVASSVRADEQRAAGLALFEDARKLAGDGKYAEACPKFEEAFGLMGGVGVAYNLADCWERTGRLASAWGMYGKAAALAHDKKETEKEKLALEKAKALEPRLPHLKIVAPDIEGLEVRWGKLRATKATFGTPIPIDPGKLTLEAKAPGYERWTKSFDVVEKQDLEVVVPALAREAPPPPPPSGSASAGPAPAPDRGAPLRIAGLVVGGVGVVTLGVGAGLGGLAIAKFDESKQAGCDPTNHCPPAAALIRTDGRAAGDASTALLVIGGAAIVAGLVVYLTAPAAPRATVRGPSGRPWMSPGGSGSGR